MRRGPLQSLAASPTMVGAVTTLIAIVAVFLAYNANQGLPFVPVYRVSVDVPNSARLVNNNEVRIGGARVGVIEDIRPVPRTDSGTTAATGDSAKQAAGEVGAVAARLDLKLDKTAEPLPQDSIFRVRYKSSFGLKFLEVIRGTGEGAPEGFTFDGTDDGEICSLPTNPKSFASDTPRSARNGCFQEQTEFDEINNTFDRETRENSRRNLVGFGDAFAARGASLNQAIEALKPLFRGLKPVAETLTADDTRLDRFFPELADAARVVAPVAREQAQMFANMADAFAAISSDEEALKEGISEGVPTLESGIRTMPAQRAFLNDLTTFSRELRPGVRDLRATLPVLNDAIQTGTPVLLRTPSMNRKLRAVLRELERLVEQPSTKITIQRLDDLIDEVGPFARHVAPAQTVCNYLSYWFTHAPNSLSDRDETGYNFRQFALSFPSGPTPQVDLQPGPGEVLFPPIALGQVQAPLNAYSGIQANGRAGGRPNPLEEGVFKPFELPILYGPAYGNSGKRNADCSAGQFGYPLGQLRVPGQPKDNPAIVTPDLPGSRGPTTLFRHQDGTRDIVDSRRPSRQPESWRGLEP